MNAIELRRNLKIVIESNLVGHVVGSPGVGKSDIIRNLAVELNMVFVDVRLAQMESQDLLGLPYPDSDGVTFDYLPPATFPLKGVHDKPERPVLVLLDEITSCPPDVQVASYRLILDRQIGDYELHDNVYLVTAGNKVTDGAVVNPMSSALVSRMVHLELDTEVQAWLRWASNNTIDPRVIAFINHSPSLLDTFSKFEDQDTLTYAVSRTYEMLSDLLKNIKKVDHKYFALITGTIGMEAGAAFVSFCSVYNYLPSYKEIVASPLTVEVSERGDVNIAIIANLNALVNRRDITKVTAYVNRLNLEYQTVFYQTLTYNNKLLLISQSVKTWLSNNSDLFND